MSDLTPDEVEASRRDLLAELRDAARSEELGATRNVVLLPSTVAELIALLEALKPDPPRKAFDVGYNIVNQLADLWEVPVDVRQATNDQCWDFAAKLVASAAPQVDREAVGRAIADHRIECTGLGEVTCRECRDKGWMSWAAFHAHVTDAVLAALYPKATEGKS